MKLGRLMIAAVLFLGAGVWLLFANCNGTTGANFGYPLSGCKLTIDITTTGAPVLVGIPLVVIGLLLTAISLIAAIVVQFQGPRDRVRGDVAPRREMPFEE